MCDLTRCTLWCGGGRLEEHFVTDACLPFGRTSGAWLQLFQVPPPPLLLAAGGRRPSCLAPSVQEHGGRPPCTLCRRPHRQPAGSVPVRTGQAVLLAEPGSEPARKVSLEGLITAMQTRCLANNSNNNVQISPVLQCPAGCHLLQDHLPDLPTRQPFSGCPDLRKGLVTSVSWFVPASSPHPPR